MLPFIEIEFRGLGPDTSELTYVNVLQIVRIAASEEEGFFRIWFASDEVPAIITADQFSRLRAFIDGQNMQESFNGMRVLPTIEP